MNEEDQSLDRWIQRKREEGVPAPGKDFAEDVMRSLECPKKRLSVALVWTIRLAAVLAAGAFGFLRIEIFVYLLTFTV